MNWKEPYFSWVTGVELRFIWYDYVDPFCVGKLLDCRECVEKFVKLALKCCQEDTDARPSMAQVVRELENIWLMMPESDTKTTDSFITEPGKLVSPSSSSTPTKNPYVSSDVSGSDLVSGVIPTIAPRWRNFGNRKMV